MLEKIGLPANPSMRGSNWVVDASHCQGCSSQFTFINRKHHCRRCGGLFCNSCTQQRMILRGQGDSPVRICDPCKKLEEAARFEMRHGHKSRTGRGGSKLTLKNDDEVLNQILSSDVKQLSLSARESTISNVVSDLERGTLNASCSNIHDEAVSYDEKGDMLEENGSNSPEELRQLSLEEKKKYRVLKGEGKPEEALRAFKRGKDLERQAKALEIALRKSSRKVLSSSNLAGIQKTNDSSEEYGIRSKFSSQVDKEDKNDLATELRELGWSDADLHDEDKKPVKMSLEGELSSLLGEVHKRSGKGTGGIDKSQVIALKKKALILKREGKLAEAKEELKKAKVLEKQLEEQEFLAEAEDSDDELSDLIRSMDDDKQDARSLKYEQVAGFDFEHLVGVPDDIGPNGNFEVTDEDLDDPEIAAALESLGWTEDSEHSEVAAPQSVSMDAKALVDEVLTLKKEAVRQKRSGNVEEAMKLLRKAKVLESDTDSLQFQRNSFMAPNPTTQKVLTSQAAGKSPIIKVDDGMVSTPNYVDPKLPKKSKLEIQRELLALKKRALILRREGRLDESEEELRKGKALECQLEEMENASEVRARRGSVSSKISESAHKQQGDSRAMGLGEENDEGDVTEKDMQDPTLLSLLENLGWKDEDKEPESLQSRPSNLIGNRPEPASDPLGQSPTGIAVMAPKRSKAEIQRELLGLKRKALTLRRQGEVEEAEEVLRMAKLLEAQMAEIEVPKKELMPKSVTDKEPDGSESLIAQETYSFQESQTSKPSSKVSVENVADQDMHNHLGRKDEVVGTVKKLTEPFAESVNCSEYIADPSIIHAPSVIPGLARRSKAELQRELLLLKRKALKLKRQGEAEEAEDVLEKAKVLEAQIEEMEIPKKELQLDSIKDKEPNVGSLMSQEILGDMDAVEEAKKGVSELFMGPKDQVSELSAGVGWTNDNTLLPSLRSNSSIFTPKMSQRIEDKTSLRELDPLADTRRAAHASSFSHSGESVNLMDLLTGDDWQSSQLPAKEVENEGSLDTNILSLDNLHVQPGISEGPNKVIGSKDEIISEKGKISVREIEKTPAREANSASISDSQNNRSYLHNEILARKRKAVALKREGNLAEAREELRQAKLLEKNLQEDKTQPDTGSTDASFSTSNVTSVVQEDHKRAHEAPKAMTGRDRFKLQQESLAHKRQALKLRREGRMEEAEAEFELAKALETQLEESSAHDSSNLNNKSIKETEATDDLGVEDLLDPQLLSALKAIGLQDVEIDAQVPDKSEGAKPNFSKSETSSQEKSQLEERIKSEKVKAVNLKRAGKQAEALDALRRAKMYEKKLNSLG